MYNALSIRVAGWLTQVGKVGNFLRDVLRSSKEVGTWAGLTAVHEMSGGSMLAANFRPSRETAEEAGCER